MKSQLFCIKKNKMRLRLHHNIISIHKIHPAFTLIELLVVIAIIALLLSIVLPAIRLAKEYGKRAVCASNSRQLTLAWILYAQENDNKLCAAWSDRPDEAPCWFDPAWDWETGALWPYIETKDCYSCPAGVEGAPVTYAVSDSMNSYPVPGCEDLGNKKMSEIITPANRMVFIDEGGPCWGGFTQLNDQRRWWDPCPDRHGNSTSVSLADGHVELWKWDDPRSRQWTYDEWLPWASGGSYPAVGVQLDNPDLIKVQRAMWRKLTAAPSN